MSEKKTYAVFGLGRYGCSVAKELINHGREVLAVDKDEKIVKGVVKEFPLCKCADVTKPEVIKYLLGEGEHEKYDTVIVCMATNFEASVMALTLCKNAGVKNVIVKCSTETQKEILELLGAKVVLPEYESGVRLAKNLVSSGFIDTASISKDFSIVEIDVKKGWVGKNLIELNLRKKYGLNVIAKKKKKKKKRGDNGDYEKTSSEETTLVVDVDPEEVLDEETTLIVIIRNEKLAKLSKLQ